MIRGGLATVHASDTRGVTMCIDCEVETQGRECERCHGTRTVDHMTCSRCGAWAQPSQIHLGDVHEGGRHGCRGVWEVTP